MAAAICLDMPCEVPSGSLKKDSHIAAAFCLHHVPCEIPSDTNESVFALGLSSALPNMRIRDCKPDPLFEFPNLKWSGIHPFCFVQGGFPLRTSIGVTELLAVIAQQEVGTYLWDRNYILLFQLLTSVTVSLMPLRWTSKLSFQRRWTWTPWTYTCKIQMWQFP